MQRPVKSLLLGVVLLLIPAVLYAQDGSLLLRDWQPKSQMIVKETVVVKPKFPAIDVHNHMRRLENTAEYLKQMDEAGVWMAVSLDGASKDDFYKEHLAASQAVSKERLLVFFRPDFDRIDEPKFGEREAARLEEAVRMGVRGIKISKALGLRHRDTKGNLVKVDDPRIDPIWEKAAELGIPVLMHVSDPKAFFTPIDELNERYDELHINPEWGFLGGDYPTKEEILNARNRVMARHPNTIFIGAHMGNLPEELGRVGMWLDQYPNFYVETSARISELGRQPYTARRFMIRYQDRVLFGTDTAPRADAYSLYYRFLETDDEYIDPTPAHKLQGRWKIYGLYLPDEVLEKIYNKNALKIFGMFKGVPGTEIVETR